MNFLIRFIFTIIFFMFPIFCFCENNNIQREFEENNTKVIDRETYQVQIKQYDKDYPMVLYIVFKELTPLPDEIRKILRTELLTFAKTEIEPTLKDSSQTKKKENQNKTKTGLETIKKVVIASAWFDDQVSENLEKIELTKKYGAFVWLYDETDKAKIFTFEEYLKYLKKKKEDFKKKEKTEKDKDFINNEIISEHVHTKVSTIESK